MNGKEIFAQSDHSDRDVISYTSSQSIETSELSAHSEQTEEKSATNQDEVADDEAVLVQRFGGPRGFRVRGRRPRIIPLPGIWPPFRSRRILPLPIPFPFYPIPRYPYPYPYPYQYPFALASSLPVPDPIPCSQIPGRFYQGTPTGKMIFDAFPEYPGADWFEYRSSEDEVYLYTGFTEPNVDCFAIFAQRSVNPPEGVPSNARYLFDQNGRGYWVFCSCPQLDDVNENREQMGRGIPI